MACYRRSLRTRALIRALGPRVDAVAEDLEVYTGTGAVRLPKRSRCTGEALSIKEKILGVDHPELAPTLTNLAALRRAEKRYTDAEALYRRALMLLEASVAPTQPNLVAARESHAALLRLMARQGEAEALETQAPT